MRGFGEAPGTFILLMWRCVDRERQLLSFLYFAWREAARIVLTSINPKAASATPSAAQVANGVPIPPVSLLPILSPDDWEQFTHEWLWFYKNAGDYSDVNKYSGAGDLGLDVVAFTSDRGFDAPWDSYQCKQYDHALWPSDIYAEVGKIIYHSFKKRPPFNQSERVPRRHVFVCPHGVGITVGRWLKDPNRFKQEVRDHWEKDCVPNIEKGLVAPLTGDLLAYFNAFDFSIFEDVSAVDLIATHAKTPFYAPRFGGGLPPRAPADPPPAEAAPEESVYLQKLLDAYGDHLGATVASTSGLAEHLVRHYDRQRVLFYSAESLRNFARDRTPPETFASLQEDIYHGIIDTCEDDHDDGLARLKEVIKTAGQVAAGGNALFSVSSVADRQGICHQLANDSRLSWVKES
ncbi:ABC-three component system protein [Methylocystis parvus]|uniref:ABC-three component system protein n=1 Tax=Methylocystis parvus TaxID=134 RepID=UPI003C739647